jgi:hypothetical protein
LRTSGAGTVVTSLVVVASGVAGVVVVGAALVGVDGVDSEGGGGAGTLVVSGVGGELSDEGVLVVGSANAPSVGIRTANAARSAITVAVNRRLIITLSCPAGS